MIMGLNLRLKSIASIAASVFKENLSLSKSKTLSLQEAKARSLRWVKTIRFQKGYVFVFDKDAMVLSHPNPELIGTSIEPLRDMKGRHISKVMDVKTLKISGQSAVFFWKDPKTGAEQKKLGYFIPFKEWQWTVCTVIGFDEIEAETQKKLQNIIKVLRKTFAKSKIGKTGYAFLFDGKGKIIVPPQIKKETDYTTIRNEQSGELHGLEALDFFCWSCFMGMLSISKSSCPFFNPNGNFGFPGFECAEQPCSKVRPGF